jgi:hypothetical protein
MDERTARLYQHDLRDPHIPCGDCAFEEDVMAQPDHQHEAPEHIVQQLARHEAWIHEIRDSSTRMIAEQGRDLKWMIEHMEKLGTTIEKIDARQDAMSAELSKHNNFQSRLKTLEAQSEDMGDTYVSYAVFNTTTKGIRESIAEKMDSVNGRVNLIVWAMGAGLGICLTALGFIIFGV